MRFEFRHQFDVSVEELERILFSNEMLQLQQQRMNTIIEIEALEVQRDGDSLKRRVRYLPQPIIKSVGPKKVEPEWMEWVEESQYDYGAHRGTFKNIPARYKIAAVMTNEGTLTIRSLGADRCERTVAGELKVKVFMVGKIAERIIHLNAARILEEEAAVLRTIILNKDI
jgi:hypothetical protein